MLFQSLMFGTFPSLSQPLIEHSLECSLLRPLIKGTSTAAGPTVLLAPVATRPPLLALAAGNDVGGPVCTIDCVVILFCRQRPFERPFDRPPLVACSARPSSNRLFQRPVARPLAIHRPFACASRQCPFEGPLARPCARHASLLASLLPLAREMYTHRFLLRRCRSRVRCIRIASCFVAAAAA